MTMLCFVIINRVPGTLDLFSSCFSTLAVILVSDFSD